MSKSARVGGFVAKMVGRGSAKLWNGSCWVAEGLGEFGEAIIEQTPIEFDKEIEAGLARKAARIAKAQALAAAALAETPALPMAKAKVAKAAA